MTIAPPPRVAAPPRPDVGARLAGLLDGDPTPIHVPDDSGVLAVTGTIDGVPVVVYATDARVMGGAMGADGCRHIVAAIELAVARSHPVIGLWHSGGARLAEGVGSLDAVGAVFAAMTRASGRVLQLSVVLGPAAGGAAYGPALTDLVVMAPDARIFVTGPDVVRSVTGQDVDMEALGGPKAHGRRSGVAHVLADSEADAFARARHLVRLTSRPGRFDAARVGPVDALAAALPPQPRRAYDVLPVLAQILDPPEGADPFLEQVHGGWARNVVVGFGRIGGHTVGVVANNPIRKGGCLDSLSAEKAARFVRLCDGLGIPLLVVVDVPGYLPGVDQEWDGVVRRGAKLLYAFAESVVPRVTLVLRKSFGGAYIAMNSRSLGATAVFAWPQAQVAVMGAEAAVGVLHRKQLAAAPEPEREALRAELVREHERTAGGVGRALELGSVDEVIDPRDTRTVLVRAFAAAAPGRGRHGNIPL